MHQRKKELTDSNTSKKSLKSSKVSEISRWIKTAKKRVFITKNKERQRRMLHISKRDCRCFRRILQKLLRGQREMTSNTKWVMTEEYLRVTKRNQQTQKRQIPRQQWNSCRRHQSLRRRDERNGETILQRDHKEEQLHTWRMEESED